MPLTRSMHILLFLFGLLLMAAEPAKAAETGRCRISLNGEWEFQPLLLDTDPAVEKGMEILRKRYSREDIDRYLPKIIKGDIRLDSLPKDAQGHIGTAYRAYKGAFEQQIQSFSGAPPRELQQRIMVPSFWTYTRDFGYPEEWKRAHAAWYGKTFLVPKEMKDRTLSLRFDAVNCLAKIFVNGRYAGQHIGGFTPFEIEITDLVRPGSQNILHVFVQDGTAMMTRQGQYTAPVGEIEHHPGIWQDVSLNIYPRAKIQGVAVKTSVRDQRIRVEVWVRNAFDRAINGTLTANVEGGIAFGEQRLQIQPKGESLVVFDRKWADPVLWSPENPHLYHLTVKLSVPVSKQSPTTDQISQPFGFREFWVEGTRFFLNGRTIRLRGDSINRIPSAYILTPDYVRAFFQAARQAHLNVVRLHTAVFPEFVLDIADEMGMLIIDEAPIAGWTPYDLSNLNHFREFFREWVTRDRNHPCVIIWSALNECLYYKKHIVPFKDMIRAHDDTRPIKFEGNGDAYGVADIFDVHYPGEDDLRRLLIILYEKQGEEKLESFRYDDQVWSGNKPMTAGEFSPIFYASPDQMAFLGGEGVYEGLFSGRNNYDAAVGEFTALQIETMRNLQFAHIAPWSTLNYGLEWLRVDLPLSNRDQSHEIIPGMHPRRVFAHYSFVMNPGLLPGEPLFRKTVLYEKLREAMSPLALVMGKRSRNIFENQVVGDAWTLHNDTPQDIRATLVYDVFSGGRIIEGKALELEIPSGRSARGKMEIRTPEVSRKETLRLDVRVTDERGVELLARSDAYTVYPKRLLAEPIDSLSGKKIGIYDKSGRTSTILQGLGVKVHDIRPPVGSDLDLLIVGKDSLDNAVADAAKAYVLQGGKLLVLEQASPSGFGRLTDERLQLETMNAPIVFPLAWGHPVFKKVKRDDMRYWCPDHLVSRLNFVKPTRGVVRALAEAGGNGGLTHAPLLEMRQGKGLLIASQLLLVEKFHDEPMAALLFRNLVAYAGAEEPGHLPRKLMIIHDQENEPFLNFVRQISIPFETAASSISSELEPGWLVLINADRINWSSLKKNGQRFLDHLTKGGNLLVQGLTPSDLGHFNRVFGTDVRVAPTSLHHPQVEKAAADAAVWGISNYDLVWEENPVRFVAYAGSGKALIKEPDKTVEFPRGLRWGDALRFTQATAISIADPGAALLKMPYGKGTILVNQMLSVLSEPKSRRCFSTLTANQMLGR